MIKRCTIVLAIALLPISGAGAADLPVAAQAADPQAESKKRGKAYSHLMRSLFAVRRGDVSRAVQEIQSAVDLQPDSPDLLVEAAQLLVQWTGRPDPSEALARRALDLDPGNSGALRFLAELSASRALGADGDRGAREESIRLFEQLIADQKEPDPNALRTLTQLRLEGQDLDGAIRSAQRLVDERPGDLRATQTLAQLLLRTGRAEGALVVLLDYIVEHPARDDIVGWTAQLAATQQGWETVVRILSERAPFPTGLGPIQHLYGQGLLRVGRIDEAIQTLEVALESNSSDLGFRKDLALAYRGIGRLADAAVLLEQLVVEAPEYPFLRQLLAETLDQQRDVQGALAAYESALAGLSDSQEAGTGHRDAIRHRLALLHLTQGDLDEVDAVLDDLELAETGMTFRIRARAAIGAKRWDAAHDLAKKLTANDQKGLAALLDGEVLVAQKRWNKAASRFAEALKLLGPEPRINIAEIYRQAGRPDPGLVLLREWVAEEPESAEAHFNLGVFYYELDRLDEAEVELCEAFRLDPDHARALNFLGYSLAERNIRLDEALEMVERALAVDAWNGAFLDSLGWIYYQMGRYDEARVPLERAARELPMDPTVLEHLGDVYVGLRQPAKALDAWDRALEAEPEDAALLRAKIQRVRAEHETLGNPTTLEGRLGTAAGSSKR